MIGIQKGTLILTTTQLEKQHGQLNGNYHVGCMVYVSRFRENGESNETWTDPYREKPKP